MNKIVFLGLGTNLGDRESLLNKAVEYIKKSAGKVILLSGIYETEPWGFQSENKFLNMVIRIETRLRPDILMKRLLLIETQLGRERKSEGYTSRTMDIDILLFDDLVINTPFLQIPHPLLQERKFVLVPLCEIAGEMVHPILNKTFFSLLEECEDAGKVTKYK